MSFQRLAIVAATAFISLSVNAANETTNNTTNNATDAVATITAPSATAAPVTSASGNTLIPSVTVPKVGAYKIGAAFDNWNTSGRQYELDDHGGRRYKMKNEYSASVVHDSGWGLQAMGVQSGATWADDKRSAYGAGDPSASLIHPTLYDRDGLKITGKFRRYFPETARSLDRHQQQWAYYMYVDYTMPFGLAAWNQLTPRYFAQDHYLAADTKYYVEDWTTLKKTANSWLKYGVGQHTQVEWHDNTTTGTVVEVYPLADLVMSKNLFFEPRVFLPVYKQSEVNDSPRAASIDNFQYELFMHMAL